MTLAISPKKPSAKGVVICLMLGLLMTLSPMLVFRLEVDNQIIFWFTALVGVPAVLVGFFLLSVPLLGVIVLRLQSTANGRKPRFRTEIATALRR